MPPSPPEVKARIRYLLHDSDPQPSHPLHHPHHQPNPSASPATPSSRLQALNLASAPPPVPAPAPNPPSFRLPPLPSPPPALVPVRAHSADSAIVPPITNVFPAAAPPQSVRSDSGISDISTVPNTARDAASFSSGPSFISLPGASSSSLTATPPHSSFQVQSSGSPPPPLASQVGGSPCHMDSNASSLTAPSASVSRTPMTNGPNPGGAFGVGPGLSLGAGGPSGPNVRSNSFDFNGAIGGMSGSGGGLVGTPGHLGMHNAVSALLASRRSANSMPAALNNSVNNSKAEADLRDKREMRRMKNRISAARSRQRKTDTFETLQRELAEAKTVIEALTRQLHRSSGGREHGGGQVAGTPSAPPAPLVIAVPQDLRPVMGRDFVSVDMLMDVLRVYIRRAQAA